MFKEAQGFSSFSVNDLAKAKKFYSEVLGQSIEDKTEFLQLNLTGGGKVMIYPKQDHQPATFTVFNIPVGNVDQAVSALNERGVRFEHYDRPGIKTDERGISHGPGPTIAWFKDPAGNILSVVDKM